MGWLGALGGIMEQLGADKSHANAEQGFDQISGMLPQGALADGLAAAFRSDQTPPFAQMAAQLFGNSGGGQQAGILNTLLATAGPMVLSKLMAGGGLSSLTSILGGAMGGGGPVPRLTEEQAAQISPEDVQELAQHAEKHDPSIVDQLSSIYAEHPALIKTLGSAALAIAMAKIHQSQPNG